MRYYNIRNWYWVVAASTTQVFSSATLSYVPITDTDYVAWLAEDNQPTQIDTANNLAMVLRPLLDYTLEQGVNLTSTGTSALNGVYALTSDAQQNITALSTGIAAGKPLPGGGSTFNYIDMSGARHAFSAVNFLNFAVAAENYIYHWGEVLADRLAGVSTALPSNNITIA